MSDQDYEFSFGPEGGTKIFHTPKEVQDWLNDERKFWTKLEQAASQGGGGASACWQPVGEFFSHVRNRLDEAERNKSADAKPYMQGLQAQFKEGFEQKRLIPSHSPRAKFLLRLAETDGATVALYAVGFFLQQEIPLERHQPKTKHECLRGSLAASYYDHNFTERMPDEKLALEELRAGWEKTFQEIQKSLAAESQRHRELNTEAAKLLDQQRQEFTELVTTERAEWTRLHKTYDESLALHKPVQYWTKKAANHRRLAWAFGIIATLIGGGVFGLLYELIQITVRPPQGTADLANWHPEYWRIAVLIAAGLFGVWVVRIFVRMFLSNVHLLTDARERATMAQTYLALMRKGGLEEKDRQLILKALFRPAGTGLVKDDAMPLTVMESLTSLGKG